MKKVTVLGLHINKTESFGQSNAAEFSCNHLEYAARLSRNMLEAKGFSFYSEAELPPEQADIVFCIDLNEDLWALIQKLPSSVHKILQVYESPFYARLSHFGYGVLIKSCWDIVMTWNRAYEADFILQYDLPFAGKNDSEPLETLPEITSEFLAQPGVVISSYKRLMGTNAGIAPLRDELHLQLSQRGIINLYGNHWKVNAKRHIYGPVSSKHKVLRQHPFALVIENTWAPGYVSEKLVDCILAGIPAIYWGDVSYAQKRFPNTFVSLEDLSVSGVIKAQKKLLADYAELRTGVLKCRSESEHWSDSYLKTISEVFSRYI